MTMVSPVDGLPMSRESMTLICGDHAIEGKSLRRLDGSPVEKGWAVNGFAVPLKLKRRYIDSTDVAIFCAHRRDLLTTNAFVIGTWWDGTWTIIDAVRVFKDRNTARANAIFNRQRVIYDVRQAKEIEVAT